MLNILYNTVHFFNSGISFHSENYRFSADWVSLFKKLQFPKLTRGNSPWPSQWQNILLLLGSIQPLISTSQLHWVSTAWLICQNELGEQKDYCFLLQTNFIKHNKLKWVRWAANLRCEKLWLAPLVLMRLKMINFHILEVCPQPERCFILLESSHHEAYLNIIALL